MSQHFKRLLSMDNLLLSWTQSFLMINILVLVMVAPSNLPIQVAARSPGLGVFFPQAFVFLLVIYTANLGQIQGSPEQPWRYHYGRNFMLYASQLAIRLSGLMLPSAALALVYLWLLAQLWGWFGLWLSVHGFSEINQFKIKYATLIVYMAATLFVPPLSPFLTLQALLDPNAALPWSYLVIAFGVMLAAQATLGWASARGLGRLESSEFS